MVATVSAKRRRRGRGGTERRRQLAAGRSGANPLTLGGPRPDLNDVRMSCHVALSDRQNSPALGKPPPPKKKEPRDHPPTTCRPSHREREIQQTSDD